MFDIRYGRVYVGVCSYLSVKHDKFEFVGKGLMTTQGSEDDQR